MRKQKFVLIGLNFLKCFRDGHLADIARFVNVLFGNGQVKQVANQVDAPNGDGGRRVFEENFHLFDAVRHFFAKGNHAIGHVELRAALNNVVVNVGRLNDIMKVSVVHHLDKRFAALGNVRLGHGEAVGNHLGCHAKAVVFGRKQNARPHQRVAVLAARVKLFVENLIERLGVENDRPGQVQAHANVLDNNKEQPQGPLLVGDGVPRVQLAHVAFRAGNHGREGRLGQQRIDGHAAARRVIALGILGAVVAPLGRLVNRLDVGHGAAVRA